MKKNLLISVFIFFSLLLKGQDSNYVEFGKFPCTWITSKTNVINETGEWSMDFVYKKTIWWVSVGEFGDFWETIKINKYPHEFSCAYQNIWEKVYFRFIYMEPRTPFILYNFGLHVGDTIHYDYRLVNNYPVYEPHYKIVKSIGTIPLENGEIRRTLTLTTPFYLDDIWVEGIGSICGIGVLNPLVAVSPINGDQYRVEYYCEQDVVLYNPENCLLCVCDINVGIEENSDEAQFSVYPNPTDGELHISFPEKNIDEIQIFNNIGQLVYKSSCYNVSENINVSNLVTGVYFLQCKIKNQLFSKKIMIK